MKNLFIIIFTLFFSLYSSTSNASIELVSHESLVNLKDKKILLAGATGNNGSHILYLLDKLDLNFRAMSRDIDKASKKFGSHYEWVQADVTKPETLVKALEGIDIVIVAIASKIPIGKNRPERVDYFGSVNMINASISAGVKRYVIITSSSSGVEDHFLNLIFNNVLLWKAKAEKYLVKSGLEYVIVCPSVINDNPGSQKLIKIIQRNSFERGMEITREDLATIVVEASGNKDAKNKVFTVINDNARYSKLWINKLKEMPNKLNHPK